MTIVRKVALAGQRGARALKSRAVTRVGNIVRSLVENHFDTLWKSYANVRGNPTDEKLTEIIIGNYAVAP